jgi:hypothetical protein
MYFYLNKKLLKNKTFIKNVVLKVFMSPNGFDQRSFIDDKILSEEIKKDLQNTEKPQNKKNKLRNLAYATTIPLFLLTISAYDATRPNITGEIYGGKFSNQKPSEIYILNKDTEKIDTFYIDTHKPKFIWNLESGFYNKAGELKEKLQKGNNIKLKIDAENKVYKITSTEPKYKQENLAKL